MKLNIGVGNNKIEGFLGLDKSEGVEPDIIRDIEKECLPFNDNSVSEIICKHTLEHLQDITLALNEMHRVLKSEGILKIIVPHKDHPEACAPNHKLYFTKKTLEKFMSSKWGEQAYGIKKWNIKSSLVNERKEIHIEARPSESKSFYKHEFGEFELDLGCGKAKDRNAIGIDFDDYGQEIIWSIEKGIPLSDNSCNFVKAHSVMEHLNDVIYTMKELHRIVRKDGVLEIVVPYASSDGSFRDPTHKNFWMEGTFDYFTEGRPRYYDINPKWKKLRVENRNNGSILGRLKPIK